MAIKHSKKSSSDVVYTGRCKLYGILIGTDGTNDPTVTVFDNTSAAGNEVIPTVTYDASLQGLSGATMPGEGILCKNGIYVEISVGGGGSVEVVILYSTDRIYE